MRVGLGQRRGDPLPPGRVDHRPGDVPAAAEDDVRLPRGEDPRAGPRRAARRAARPAAARRRAAAAAPRSGTGRTRSPPPGRAAPRCGQASRRSSRCTPRARSASATASDGITWPAVPPAAITHRSSDLDAIAASDVKEDADRREHDDEAGASIGHQGQRDSGQRRDPDDGREVERRLAADQRRQARGERLPERVAGSGARSAAPPRRTRRTRRSRASRRRGRAPRR